MGRSDPVRKRTDEAYSARSRIVGKQETIHKRACGKFEDGLEGTDTSVRGERHCVSAVAFLVAGGGFEPPTFGLCDLTHLSMRVGLYLHPRGMLAIQSLYGVPHRVPVQRHMHRLADIDLPVAIAREIGGLQQADGDARREQLPIPRAVVRVSDLSRIYPLQNFA